MKVIIFRTFAHNRIWEGLEPMCHYENGNYDLIKKWEPDIVNKTISDVKYGIGIYTEKYYNYRTFSGNPVYTKTEAEHHPSILSLEPFIKDSNRYGTETHNPNEIRIRFSFIKKINEINKVDMIKLDELFINNKLDEIGKTRTFTNYPSLCFSLEESNVIEILRNFGVSITNM